MSKKQHSGRTRPLKINNPPSPPSGPAAWEKIASRSDPAQSRATTSIKNPAGHSGRTHINTRIGMGTGGMKTDANRSGLVEWRNKKDKFKKK